MASLNTSVLTGTASVRGMTINMTVNASTAAQQIYSPPAGKLALIKSMWLHNNDSSGNALNGHIMLAIYPNGTANYVRFMKIDLEAKKSMCIIDSNTPINLHSSTNPSIGSPADADWPLGIWYDGYNGFTTYLNFYMTVIEYG